MLIKQQNVLGKSSTNIIPAEPTTEGIENGLVRAIKNIENYDSRVSGANVHWSQSWEETFNKQCMEKIKGFIRQCMEKTKGSNDRHVINQHLFTDREEKLANAYIETAAKNPNTFVDVISPEDEMYITSRNSTEQKDTAKYLYFIIGRECFKSIENIIRFSGKSFREVRTFLDFACGYGRVTRFLIQEIESTKVWVSDIYKDAVDFQKKYFMVNGFYSETEPSRLVFPGNFEIIYVGSLFSHLPANRFEEWLSTLYNVLDDDGILIFSTHGESLCPEGLQIDPSGFTFFNWSESRSLSSKEYGSTFVKRDWVEGLGKKIGIANIYFLEKELRGFQDIYVVTKKNIPQMNNLMPTHYPMGNIDSVWMTQDGGLSIFGWAIGKGINDPVKEIFIYANAELVGKATLGMPRPDVEKHFDRADCLNSGWEFKVGGSVLKEVISKDTGFNIIKVFIKSESDDVSYLISSY